MQNSTRINTRSFTFFINDTCQKKSLFIHQLDCPIRFLPENKEICITNAVITL